MKAKALTEVVVPLATLDAWFAETVEAGAPEVEDRGRHELFSSAYEFAVWAAAVRKVNAEHRLKVKADDERARNR